MRRPALRLVEDDLAAPRESDIGFDAVGEQQWRVVDRRRAEDDVRGILGFAEGRAGVVQLTFIDEPAAVHWLAHLDAVRRFVVTEFREREV